MCVAQPTETLPGALVMAVLMLSRKSTKSLLIRAQTVLRVGSSERLVAGHIVTKQFRKFTLSASARAWSKNIEAQLKLRQPEITLQLTCCPEMIS